MEWGAGATPLSAEFWFFVDFNRYSIWSFVRFLQLFKYKRQKIVEFANSVDLDEIKLKMRSRSL